MDYLASFLDSFLDFPWRDAYGVVRTVFIVLDAALFVGFIYALVKAFEYRPKFYRNLQSSAKKIIVKDPTLIKRWAGILEKSKFNPPQSFVLAIIEADKFVDDILKRMGLQGEHMADRLERLSTSDLKTLEKLWRVHKIRNELVHSPDFEISPRDAGEVLETYEEFLREIDVV